MAKAYSVQDRLNRARRNRFVGREAELALFRRMLAGTADSASVLYLHGPGGVGKSTLLDRFCEVAADSGIAALKLDARDVEPSPTAVQQAIRDALSIGDDRSIMDAIAELPRFALLIDTYEKVASLDDWLREQFLPRLPGDSIVVLAGRQPPSPSWRSDGGWSSLTRFVPLRNLRPDEAATYLRLRGVDEARIAEFIDVSYGHPLALSLLADLDRQYGHDATISLKDEPDLVSVLVERFVRETQDGLHREALEACAHTRVTTEELLRHVLRVADASDVFAWLMGLSFIQIGPQGLYPHDLARDVIDADFRWRDRARYRNMHAVIRALIIDRIHAERGVRQQQAASDLLFLHRNGPMMGKMYDWATLGSGRAEPARDDDLPSILALVERFEGATSAQIARYWYERQPAAFRSLRDSADRLIGFCASLVLTDPVPADLARDPAIASAWSHIERHGPLRPGEVAIYHRFQMDATAYQQVSPGMNLTAVMCCVQWMTTERLAWSFLPATDPWGPVFSYLNFTRHSDAGFTIDGRRTEVFVHDWRAEPVERWLEVMGDREIASDMPDPRANRPAPVQVLSRPDFDEAVRQALRDLHRVAALGRNPLCRSRCVGERAAGGSPAGTLTNLLREAVATLQHSPRDRKLYRALVHTYLEPAPTQEAAAELLGLPFTTYRYHLSGGIRRVSDYLWDLETGR